MNITHWSGKQRRSASDLNSSSGSGFDGSDSPLLLSGPVLSPPPGLGRSLKDRGRRPAGATGTPRHSVGSSAWLLVARCPFDAELARLQDPLGSYSLSQFVTPALSGMSLSVDKEELLVRVQRPPGISLQVVSGFLFFWHLFTETTY